jgi:hypothetical protein
LLLSVVITSLHKVPAPGKEVIQLTTSSVLVIAVTAFLSGAAAAVFAMLVVGIRKADKPRRRAGTCTSPLDAVTQSVLGAGSWPNGPALGDRETD